MHDDCVPEAVARVAGLITPIAAEHGLALGGGTACALHLGHRLSGDLDLFSLGALEPTALLSDLQSEFPGRLRGITQAELAMTIYDVEIFATSLGRPPLEDPEDWEELPVLAPNDLAELKLDAAVARGTVRDLCDLHLLCLAGADLRAALEAGSLDTVVALKALTDPERFAGQPALALRRPWSVEEATAYFTEIAQAMFGRD